MASHLSRLSRNRYSDARFSQTREGSTPRSSASLALVAVLALGMLPGCVSVAEFRKLERQVIDLQRQGSTGSPDRQELAETGAEIDAVRTEVRAVSGRLEVVEKRSKDALTEVRRLRTEVAGLSAQATAAAQAPEAPEPDSQASAGEPVPTEQPPVSAEVQAYRAAYASWRGNQHETCIEEFRAFLQTYPASAYADDSAFWMADCHFKQGDYKNAVLRFDDVVRNYPTGNKAPDALFRQGESLLKLGPSYHEAAKRAFQRVLKEYPDSARAREAQAQLDLIGIG